MVTGPNDGPLLVVASGGFTPAEKFEIKRVARARTRAHRTARGAFLSPTQRVIKRRSRRQKERTSPGEGAVLPDSTPRRQCQANSRCANILRSPPAASTRNSACASTPLHTSPDGLNEQDRDRAVSAAFVLSIQPMMIVCNVSLSCAHCPGEGTAASEAYAQASGSLAPPTLSQRGHLVVAVCLGVIGTVGFLSNFLVLALFCRYRALRTPMNLMLVSISASDLLVSVLGTPFSFAASTQGRWLIGRDGCVWYGFVNSCLGEQLLSLTKSLIEVSVCTGAGLKARSSDFYSKALVCV